MRQLPPQLPMPFVITSSVYRYYEHYETNTNQKPKLRCRLCFEQNPPINKTWTFFGSTSCFNSHLQKFHNDQWKLVAAANGTISNTKNKPKELDRATIELIDSAVRKWILTDGHSFSVLERRGFQEFMKTVLPNYKPKSRNTISRAVENDYNTLFAKYKEKISKCEQLTITTDMWKSKNTLDCYLGVTVHFYDVDHDEMNTCTIACELHTDEETGEGIKKHLEKVLNEWGIRYRVVLVVADGGPNMVKAIRLLGYNYVHCVAHRLNLIFSHFTDKSTKRNSIDWDMKPVAEVITKAQKLSTHFREQKAMKMLTKLQIDSNVKRPKKTKIKIDIRWNSCYLMLNRVIELWPYILQAYHKDKSIPVNVKITSDEMEIIEDLVKALRPLYDATVALSGRYYPTLSMAIPIATGLLKYIDSLISVDDESENNVNLSNADSEQTQSSSLNSNNDIDLSDTENEYDQHSEQTKKQNESKILRSIHGEIIKKSLQYQIESYLSDLEHSKPACVATILDPRFGKYHFRNATNYEEALKHTIDQLESDHFAQNISTESISESLNSTPIAPKRRKLNKIASSTIWEYSDLAQENEREQNVDNSEIDFNKIIKNYKSLPILNRHSDPLKYNFPAQISKTARIHLCMTATSVPSESMFSDAGNTLSKTRSNLAPDKVNKIMFIHSIYNHRLASYLDKPSQNLQYDNYETESEDETNE